MFSEFDGYEKPVVQKINKHVTIGIHYPMVKDLDAVIEIYSSKKKVVITLYSKSLLDISNSFIETSLKSSRFFFNNTSKKLNKKGFKKSKRKSGK